MTYPNKPEESYAYGPSVPGMSVRADFAEHKASIDEIIDFLQVIQRSDGRLKSASVRYETLDPSVQALLPDGGAGVYDVASLADLKAMDPPDSARTVVTQYRTTAGDGGGGVWVWRSGDQSANVSADTQSGIWAAPTASSTGTNGAWQRVFSGVLFAEWFGAAAANSAADNTTAFNAAILYAKNGAFGAVQFGKGSFAVTSLTMQTGVSLYGTDRAYSKLVSSTSSAKVLDFTDVWMTDVVVRDMTIHGVAGSTTAIYVGASTEITAQALFKNLRLINHQNGIDGGSTYGLFDSAIENVDFLNIAGYGLGAFGSQIVVTDCKFRICGYGAYIKRLNGFSVGGPKFFGCTWIQCTYDVMFDGSTIRPCLFDGCWMEQTVTACLGTLTAGTQNHLATTFVNTIFQPAGTATDVVVLNAIKGTFSFKDCVAYNSPLAAATLPSDSWSSITAGSTVYTRTGCIQSDGSTFTPLADVVLNPSGQFLRGAAGTAFYYEVKDGTRRAIFGLTAGNVPVLGTTSNDPLYIYSNNTERVRIEAAGNIGLGGAPNRRFTVVAPSSTAAFANVYNGSQDVVFGLTSGNIPLLGTLSNDPLYVYTNNSERIRIEAAGNIGLGGAPNQRLTVVTASSTAAYANVYNGSQNIVMGLTAGNAPLIGTLSNDPVYIFTNNSQRGVMDAAGNLVWGPAGVATTATGGFLYIASCAGTPTGVPSSYSNRVPLVWDRTNKKLYIYDGSWLGGTTPGAFT